MHEGLNAVGPRSVKLGAERVVLIQSASIFIATALWQQRWGTNVDVSSVITVAERVLGGARLYVDIVDSNPPFSTWIYLPAVAFAHMAGIAPEIGVFLFTCVAVMIGLGLSALIIRRAGFVEANTLLRIFPLFLAIFTIFPGNAFSEREHLGTALFLPLLAIMAWRGDLSQRARPGILLAVLAGLCGSVLLLVKPYYAVVYIAPALYVVWRRRNPWLLLAPEYCIVGVVSVAYLALVFWLSPEFIWNVLPQMADIYMAAGEPGRIALHYAPPYLMLLFLVWKVAPRVPLTSLAAVTLLASIAAIGPLIYQGKGWAYHAFPAISLGFVAVLCRAASSDWHLKRQTFERLGLGVVVLAFAGYPFLETQKPDAAFVVAVEAAAPKNPTIGVIGLDIAAAHPLARMIGARFVSAYGSDWLGALAFDLSRKASARGDVADAARYQNKADTFLDEKYREFVTVNYDLIVIQRDVPPWTNFVLGQQRFALLLSAYHPVAEEERFVVYSRSAHMN